MNTPSEASAELARVVAEVAACNGESVGQLAYQAHLACFEFIRKHGASLLSSHGGGGEAVDDPVSVADVAGVLGEMAEGFDGGEYNVSDDARRALIDFAHGIPEHPLFAVVGHYFAQNPVAGSAPPPQPRAEGMVLVPREPTEAMLDALRSQESYCDSCHGVSFNAETGYEKMLAAAPGEGSGL